MNRGKLQRLWTGFAAGLAVILAASAFPASANPVSDGGRLRLGELSHTDGGARITSAGTLERSGKGKKKAVFLSLVIPGAGQAYLGHGERAKHFLLAELGVWAAFGVLQLQGKLRKDAYEEYAELFAGAERGMDDDYYRAVGKYLQSDPPPYSYNEEVRRDARARYPDDREAQLRYEISHGYWGDESWSWESAARQEAYLDLRRASNRAFHHSNYFIAGMIVNHILSAIDAARLASRDGEADLTRDSSGWDLKFVSHGPRGCGIILQRYF